jgi:hypothetical protein
MAKKSTSSPAFVFEFWASTLQTILDGNPDKVVFTVAVEAVEAKAGGKVGALRIKAKGVKSAKVKSTAKSSAAKSTAAFAMMIDDGSGSPHPPGLPPPPSN